MSRLVEDFGSTWGSGLATGEEEEEETEGRLRKLRPLL